MLGEGQQLELQVKDLSKSERKGQGTPKAQDRRHNSDPGIRVPPHMAQKRELENSAQK